MDAVQNIQTSGFTHFYSPLSSRSFKFLELFFYRSKMNMTKETFDKVSSKIGSKNLSCCGAMGEVASESKQQTDDSQMVYK